MSYRKVRPMPHEKVERNAEMVRYALEHPEATHSDIGRVFDVSAARAGKIVTREKKKMATAE